MPSTSSIHEFLRESQVAYTIVTHGDAFGALEDAAAVHVPGPDWAKVVVCFVDGQPVQAVVPALLAVNLTRFLDLTRGAEVRLALEDEVRRLFPECELGAMPPFGQLYGQSVFVDVTLAAESEIVFNVGTHNEAIRMRWADFAARVRPIVGRFAEPRIDSVGAHRLSYRE